MRAIRDDILAFQPSDAKEEDIYGKELTEVANLFQARRNRNDIATSPGLPPILIQGIVFLAIITLIALPIVGSLKNPRHMVLYAIFCILTISTLFFIFDLNNPFRGSVAVDPDAFNILFTGTFKNVS